MATSKGPAHAMARGHSPGSFGHGGHHRMEHKPTAVPPMPDHMVNQPADGRNLEY